MPYPFNYGYNTNNYYPQYGYNSYSQYPPVQQMMQNAQQTAQPQMQSPSSIIWVKNQQEAAMYPIAPNNAVALWDQSAASVYLKQADASGKPTMKIYDLVERAETATDGTNENESKPSTYATKDDLGAVLGVVNGFDEVIGALKSDIETMKSDIYGIAGKKKMSKKVKDEDAEDDE